MTFLSGESNFAYASLSKLNKLHKITMGKIDLKRWPYRGALVEASRRLDISPEMAWYLYHKDNPDVRRVVAQIIDERRQKVERAARGNA